MAWNSILKKFFKGTERRNTEVLKFLKEGVDTGVNSLEAYNYYNFNSAISDSIDIISKKFASISPVIKNKNGEIIKDHKVLKFLETPNKTQIYNEFANDISVNYLLDNNLYIEVLGFINASPSEIYPVKNNRVNISESSNSATYTLTTTGFYEFLRGVFIYEPEIGRISTTDKLREVLHIKGFSLSTENLKAVSIISSIKRDADMLDQTNVHNLSLIKKGFSSSAVFNVDTDDDDALDQFKKDLNARNSGAGNAGSSLVSKGKDINVVDLSQTNKDMEYSEVKKMAKATIYKRYGIPTPLVESSSQTFNNYQTALFALYDDTVLPLADKIYSALTKMFIDRKMLGEGEYISYDISTIPAMQLRVNEEIKILNDSYTVSTNEKRTLLGYESIGSEGDQVLAPATLMPIGEDDFTVDNRDEPSKKFSDLMRRNGASEQEVKDAWTKHQSSIK